MNKIILSAIINIIALSSFATNRCDQLFVKESDLARYTKGVNQIKNELNDRLQDLINKYPDRIKILSNTLIQQEDSWSGLQNLVVISTYKMKMKDKAQLKNDYIQALSYRTVSFPLKESGGHLYTRFGNKVIDDYYSTHVNPYKFPVKDEWTSQNRLETFIALTEKEYINLASYIEAVRTKRQYTIGAGSDYEGTIYVNEANLFNNVGSHNCTSWIATARIGENGESLKELVGASPNYNINTNPGWWTMFLNTQANKQKVPFTVLITDEPIDSKILSLKANNNTYKLNWNFGTH